MLTEVDTDKYRVHYDKIVNSAPGFKANQNVVIVPQAGILDRREQSMFHAFTVNTNKTITYKTDNGIVPQGANTYILYVIPYDAKGSQPTDNIASLSYQLVHEFKDA